MAELSKHWLILAIFLALAVASLVFLKIKKKDKIKSDSWFYLFIGFVLFALLGLLSIPAAQEKTNAGLWLNILQGIFCCLGILHALLMYSTLYFTTRNEFDKNKDSFWPEFAFTLGVYGLGSLGFALVFLWQAAAFAAPYFWCTLPFLFPFLVLKTYDFAQQIMEPDYDKKFVFSLTPLNALDYEYNRNIDVVFKVVNSYNDQGKLFGKVNTISISRSPGMELGKHFQICVDNANADKQKIKDERVVYASPEGEKPIWWLFQRRFVLWKPPTWSPSHRYFDPFSTLEENGWDPSDIIIAKRKLF